MDRLTEQLLAIESDAQEAMNTITKENAQLALKAEEGLAKRIAKIEQNNTEAIRKLSREAEDDAAAKIAAIQEEYLRKWESFEEEFMANKNETRTKIFQNILAL